jgi:hypothetical protein
MKKLLLGAFLFISTIAYSQDRIFTYTYQSTVLNPGQKELEIWTTLKTGREDFYRGLDHRLEFEVGLGKKIQTAFYLNYGYSNGIYEKNGIEVQESNNSYSFANEWKLKLSDPVADKLGSALYFEYTLAPDETELEGKIILDKQTGRFVNAFNAIGELELEKEFEQEGNELEAETEKEYKLAFNYGLSYNISNKWNVGIEAKNDNVFHDGELEFSILSAGPVVSYSTSGFWINFGLMPQITNLKGGGRELYENDGLQARLIFSYVF